MIHPKKVVYTIRPIKDVIAEAMFVSQNEEVLTDGATHRRIIAELVDELTDPERDVQILVRLARCLCDSAPVGGYTKQLRETKEHLQRMGS